MPKVDDLFNDWGVFLIDSTATSSTRGTGPVIPSERDTTYQVLKNEVQSLTNQMYTLHRVESCGSTCNTLAIFEASQGDSKSCVYAVGTYIAGDQGYLNSLSLSSRQLSNHGLVLPLRREQATSTQIMHWVTLPYYIPARKDVDFFRSSEKRGTME